MLQRIIDDLKDSTGATLRMSGLAALAGSAMLVTLSFVAAAVFLYVMHRQGAIVACLTLAGLFLVLGLIVGGIYLSKKRRIKARAMAVAQQARRAAENAAPTFDPMLLATALPIVKAIGLKRLIPILAIAGAAYGYYMSRGAVSDDAETSNDDIGD